MGKNKLLRRYFPAMAGGLIVALALVGLIWVINGVLSKKSTTKRQTVQIIKLIRPPPVEQPPPPPPPPEKVEQPLPKDTPEVKPDQSPPDQPLGLDADASAGSDGFGLAARKGGQDLIGSTAGAFSAYTNLLKSFLLDALSDDERLRRCKCSVILRVRLASDGRVEAVAQPSGNVELDAYLQQALAHLPRMREAPPLEMPQPVTLKIVSRS